MPSLAQPLHGTVHELQGFTRSLLHGPSAEFLCQVELGLHLRQQGMTNAPAAHTWVLFSGHGFAKAYGVPLSPDAARALKVVRYLLWAMGRSRAWRETLQRYQRFDPALRGWDVEQSHLPAIRREVSVGVDRWQAYDYLQRVAALERREVPVAGPGPHAFLVGRSLAMVDLPRVPPIELMAHDVDLRPVEQWRKDMADCLELTLLLGALEPRLALNQCHVAPCRGSAWVVESSRYHVPVAVGGVIEPRSKAVQRIAAESEMRFAFIDDGTERMRVSGTDPEDRPAKLRRVATWLGAGADDVEGGGPMEQELLSLPPGRDQILLLEGSYQDAPAVADTLHNLNGHWRAKVLCLVSDDEGEASSAQRARILR